MEAEPFTPLGSAIKQLPSSKGKHAEANEKKSIKKLADRNINS